MNKILYGMIAGMALCATPLMADRVEDPMNDTKYGVFCGHVVDAEANTLPGATVMIKDLQTGTVSDVNGFYRVTGLKAGKYVVKVSYVGYAPSEFTIEIKPGVTLSKKITLNEGAELQEVVVGGSFSGQLKALNSQRKKMGVVNVVSADQVGKFPDSNIGDALKRISGINVQYDQGEARFGQVRGTSADLSSVTVNGNRLPSAEGDVRNVQLDLIPSDMIQTIEVNKVVTADMDADAIGGSINLITKNTPLRQTMSATVGSGWNFISNKPQLNLGLTYGNRFLHNKLGVMAALSYQNAPAGSDNVEFEYDRDENTGRVFLTQAQTRQYYVTRQRQSYSLSLDYDLNANHHFSFKSIYNRRHDWENRYRISYKGLDKPSSATATIQTKAGDASNRNARLELQQTMDFSLGGDHQWNLLNMRWNVSLAKASEDRPEERYMAIKGKGTELHVAEEGERFPYVTDQLSYDKGKWSLNELTNSNQTISETDRKARLDFTLPLSAGKWGTELKFGAKYMHKSKERSTVVNDYADAYSEQHGTDYMNHLATQVRSGFMPGSRYQRFSFVDKAYIGHLNFTTLAGERLWEESSGNYTASEGITAAYFRINQRLGKAHNLVLGLRMEHTGIAYQGVNWTKDAQKVESIPPTEERRNSYTNWLPSVLYKWEVNDNLMFRASYTQTIARPKYVALVPNVYLDLKDSKVTVGNPQLKPTLSHNIDLFVDRYFKGIGQLSAGIFYKRINNFIVEQRTSGAFEAYPDVDFSEITRSVNGGNANLFGAELAFQRSLDFISPVLRNLTFYGNYTFTHSKVSHFNFEGRENEQGLSLPGSPQHSANASLAYERGGLSVRLSYNHASSFIDEMGKHASLDRYYDAVNYLDANASYTFGKQTKFTIFAEAGNLLNQPLRYYQGEKQRTMQVEYYGVRLAGGVKINL